MLIVAILILIKTLRELGFIRKTAYLHFNFDAIKKFKQMELHKHGYSNFNFFVFHKYLYCKNDLK